MQVLLGVQVPTRQLLVRARGTISTLVVNHLLGCQAVVDSRRTEGEGWGTQVDRVATSSETNLAVLDLAEGERMIQEEKKGSEGVTEVLRWAEQEEE